MTWIANGESGSSVRTKLNTIPNNGTSFGGVTEAQQTLADNTINNVSITKHGYAPKSPNDATKYLDGTGAYMVPGGGGGGGWVAAQVAYTLANAAPTDVVLNLTVMAMRVGVTTDGSGLAQVINIPNFTLGGNGEASKYTGYRVSVTNDAQTVGGDIPLVTVNGGADNCSAYDTAGRIVGSFVNTTGSGPAPSVPINYAGATITFEWAGIRWVVVDFSDNNDGALTGSAFYIPVGGGSGQILVKLSGTDGDIGWADAQSAARTALGFGTTILNFTATLGAVTPLTGTAVTQTITGLLTTDQVHVECVSAPPSGYIPPNARVSASDTLSLYFNTAVALGITLGSLNFRLTVIR